MYPIPCTLFPIPYTLYPMPHAPCPMPQDLNVVMPVFEREKLLAEGLEYHGEVARRHLPAHPRLGCTVQGVGCRV